ncbi:MAG: hypothetical protein HEP71_08725 [Roseivirga sp.]|nr:hypothetical protein [Roseivirga sp.]
MIAKALPPSAKDLIAVNFNQLADELLMEIPVLETKIEKGAAVKMAEVQPLLVEVLRFLFLIGTTNQKLTPSLVVDLAWHEFILCTRRYQSFCDEHFERFIHHHPGGKEDSNQKQFQLTHKLYREHIGVAPEQFWGKNPMADTQSDCGLCEAI